MLHILSHPWPPFQSSSSLIHKSNSWVVCSLIALIRNSPTMNWLAYTSSNAPSVFECMAQQRLPSSIESALRHSVTVLAQRSPRFLWLHDNFDEVFMFLRLVTEHYHITRHSASVSEHFMLLKRVRLSGGDMSPRQRILSIYFLVMIPYALRKLKLDHTAASMRMALQQQPPTFRQRVEQQVRSAILAAEPLLSIVCMLLYAAKGCGPYQAHHWLLGLKYLRATNASSPAAAGHPASSSSSNSRFSQLFSSVSQVFGSPWLLTLFALRLTEWWFAASSLPTTSIAAPPPPPPQQFLSRPNQPGLCCVCFKRIPVGSVAVLPTGAVGCYSCIVAAAQRGVCPSTGAQLQNDAVRRVFEQ